MVTLCILLDLSAAFDTIEHSILLDILQTRFGITDAVLNWHKAYLSERSYRVVIGGAESDVINLDCELPQGSSFGSVKFIAYAAEMEGSR